MRGDHLSANSSALQDENVKLETRGEPGGEGLSEPGRQEPGRSSGCGTGQAGQAARSHCGCVGPGPQAADRAAGGVLSMRAGVAGLESHQGSPQTVD